MADLTPDEFRRRGYAVVDWIASYRAGLPDRPVQPDVAPGSVRAALHRADPGWREEGVDGRDRVYVTAETHSSLAKAVRVAGLGARALRTVGFRPGSLAMDPESLGTLVAEDRAAGLRPVLVCPTVGTTGTGAVDPVAEVVDTLIDSRPGVWVHVDAAWAGVAALCPEHRDLLEG